MAGAIGPQGVTQLEMLRLVSEGKIQITPHVMVSGGSITDALAGTILGNNLLPIPMPTPEVKVSPAPPITAVPVAPARK
jgi:hypothetical protein